MNAPLRIGTRASKLARAQAQMVMHALMQAHGLPKQVFEIVARTTAGDRDLHKQPAHWGYKGLFTKELEDALLEGEIDLAVHSMKDMPSELPDGLVIAAMLERADVRDAWVSPSIARYSALPKDAVVGTSSARRAAQLLHRYPGMRIVPLRGNVQTRIDKLNNGEADGTFLACAGLARLGLQDVVREAIDLDAMLPAVAQGAIGIECRAGDDRTRTLLAPLDHGDTSLCVDAERAFLRVLDGSCRTPIAGYAVIDKNQLWLRGEVLSLDGKIRYHRELRGTISDGVKIGETLGEALRADCGPALLENMP
jgi:hydroxymethylbilane synthase